MPLDLELIPENYPMGYCAAPETREDYPVCDVPDCEETPLYEVYFGGWLTGEKTVPELDQYWYYVCRTHLEAIAQRTNTTLESEESENG